MTIETGRPNAPKSGQAKANDFTSLVAEYELSKARTDFRSQPKAKSPDSVTVSDIPGLGQFRNRERSLPPQEDAFRPRNRSDNYYGPGSSYSRENQASK
jgi:hypothetical protein